MRTKTLVFALVVCTLLVPGGGAVAGGESSAAIRVGRKAPGFTGTGLDGRIWTLEGIGKDGKHLVLNFWGLRCGACIEEMPSLNSLQGRFKGAVFLGVNVDGINAEQLRGSIGKVGLEIRYEVIPDPEMRLMDLYEVSAAPLTIVIDKLGVIRYVHENYQEGDEKELADILTSISEK